MSENNNAKVYKLIKEKDGKRYVNYYVDINGFNVCFNPKFLTKEGYKALYYIVPNKEVK